MQDLRHLSYKHDGSVFLTYEGLRRVAEISGNPNAKINRDRVMVLLKQHHEVLRATMHVSSGTGQAAPPAGPVPGPVGGASTRTEDTDSVGSCDDSITMANATALIASGDKINALSTSVVQCTQSIRECGQELVKINEVKMDEIINFVTTVVDKSPALQDSMKIITDARQRFVEIDQQALEIKREDGIVTTEIKQRHIELDRQASIVAAESKQREMELERQASIDAAESKQRQIELERQASIVAAENRQRMLEMDNKEFQFSELKKDSHKKRAQEEESETQRKQQRREAQASHPQAESVRITVRSVIGKHPTIFDGIPYKDRKDVLMKAGSRCAQSYREAGHFELPKVREGQYDVAVYEEEFEELIIAALQWAVEDYNNQYGEVTIEDMSNVITKRMTKAEKSKILRAAEGIACGTIQMKPGGKLLKKRGHWQTFDDEDRPMLIASIREVMRQRDDPQNSKPLESFFSTRASAVRK